MRHRLVSLRFLSALLLTAAFSCGASVIACAQQQSGGPQPLSEYKNVPKGLMMIGTQDMSDSTSAAGMSADKNSSSANDKNNGNDDNQVMSMADIRSAYAQGKYKLAAKHLKLIASDSYPGAEELLGIMYHNGQGVPKNPALAFKWLKKAAEAGHGLAAHYLGSIFYAGDGVLQNPVTATMWFYIAVNNNPDSSPDKKRAESDLENISAGLGRRNREQAYSRAKNWLESHNFPVHITPP